MDASVASIENTPGSTQRRRAWSSPRSTFSQVLAQLLQRHHWNPEPPVETIASGWRVEINVPN